MSSVAAYEDRITIPTYRMGPPNLNPVIIGYRGLKSYPYAINDDLSDVKEDVTYAALVMENDYLKVIVLPELGGRLYSAFDKRNGREIFYRNHVIKPQLVGLTGAWFAGGIEWNFPKGHRPSTMAPIATAHRRNDDGSASLFIGETDRITGLRFTVELRLHPGKAYLEEIVSIHNPTDLPLRYMFWSTSAEYGTAEMELRYPMKWTVDEHTRERHPWPYRDNAGRRDMRWLKNTWGPTSIFGANVRKDFFGTYDRALDCGVVHVGNHREVPGKKMWDWGMDRTGREWNELLTDEDGPYVEVQSGCPETQNEFLILDGHASRTWREYWFQAFGTGPFTHAGLYGAMSWRLAQGADGFGLELRICANESFPACTVEVMHDDKPLHTEEVDLDPMRPTRVQVALATEAIAEGTLSVAIQDRDGGRLMREAIRRSPPSAEDLDAPAIALEKEPEGTKSHKALVDEQFDRRRQALAGFAAVLAENPDCVAAHLHRARIFLKMSAHREAEETLRAALAKEPGNSELLYHLALVHFHCGERQKAKDALYYVTPNSEWYGSAALLQGKILLAERDYWSAEANLRSALQAGLADCTARLYLCYALRRQGRTGAAEDSIARELAADPLNLLAWRERIFLCAQQGADASAARAAYRARTMEGPYDVLTVAAFYQEIGDYAAAREVVEDCQACDHPLLLYHAGYYLARLGDPLQARASWERAERQEMDHVFPNHPATLDVLEQVIADHGSAAVKARYYLGLLYQARERYGEALRLWEECVALGLEYSVLHCSLAYITWKIGQNPEKAGDLLEQALDYRPSNPEILIYLNLIHRELGETEKRRALLGRIEAYQPRTQGIARTLVNLYVDLGRWDDAVRLFESYRFRRWEHDDNPVLNLRALGTSALLGRAVRSMADGQYGQAVTDLLRCLEIVGLDKDKWAKVQFCLGICREKQGDLRAALECYRPIAQGSYTPGSIGHGFQLKALDKMVELEWAGIE